MQERDNRSGNIDSNFCDPAQCDCGGRELFVERDGSEIRNSGGGNNLDREEQYDWLLTLAKMWDDPVNDFDIKLPHKP